MNLRKKIKADTLTFILIILIGGVTLFVRPIIGVADNGDYYRIISQNDLYHLPIEENDKIIGYFNRNYGEYKYANEAEKVLISTQSVFIKIAKVLDNIISNDYIFDIRYLSFILLLLQAVAGYLLVKYFTSYINKEVYKYIIAVLYVFIFCDTGYISYFNSFYGEGVIVASFLVSAGILLNMFRFNKINFINLTLFAITSLLFFGAKQQLSPIGILIALIFVRILIINKERHIKIISSIFALLFIGSSGMFYLSIQGDFDFMNRFHAMNRGVLLNEENPEEILEEFNINPNYALLQEEIYFEKIPSINPADERLKENFYSNYSVVSILKYYIKNPDSFMKVIKMGFRNSYTIRPEAMGNFEKREGYPFAAKTNFFTVWSYSKDNFIPKNIAFSIFFIAIYFYFSFKRYMVGIKDSDYNIMLPEEAFVYIFLAGLSQVVISVVGAGDADLSKHVFLYNLAFDLMVINLVVQFLKGKEG